MKGEPQKGQSSWTLKSKTSRIPTNDTFWPLTLCLNKISEFVVGSDTTELKIAGFILCNCALIWQSGVKTAVKTGSAERTCSMVHLLTALLLLLHFRHGETKREKENMLSVHFKCNFYWWCMTRPFTLKLCSI